MEWLAFHRLQTKNTDEDFPTVKLRKHREKKRNDRIVDDDDDVVVDVDVVFSSSLAFDDDVCIPFHCNYRCR